MFSATHARCYARGPGSGQRPARQQSARNQAAVKGQLVSIARGTRQRSKTASSAEFGALPAVSRCATPVMTAMDASPPEERGIPIAPSGGRRTDDGRDADFVAEPSASLFNQAIPRDVRWTRSWW